VTPHAATRNWIVPAVLALVAGHAAWSVMAYGPAFAGDSEIHIVFARNLIAGYPLQFNPGIFSSGETSPLYMLIVAAMSLAMGAYVAIGMKLVGAASLVGLCFVIGREAARQGASRDWAAALGVLPLLLPSMVFQASIGMENMLFAFLVVAVLQAWLAGRSRMLVAAVILPLLFFLRPEALLVGIALGGVALLERDWRSLGALAAGAAIVLAGVALLTAWTGVPLQAAGLARAALAPLDGTALGLFGDRLWLSFKSAPFLLYCVPFAVVAWLYRASLGQCRHEAVVFGALFCLPLLLHLLVVFPSTHFSRYFAYGYAVFFFLFARLMARVDARWPVLAAVGLLASTLAPYEQVLRNSEPRSSVFQVVEGLRPDFVRSSSDALYRSLGRPPLPVVMALQEVQIRGWLDERFIVWPLDGIVDHRFRHFVRGTSIDLAGYLRARNVTYVFGKLPVDAGPCLRPMALQAGPSVTPEVVYAVVGGEGCER